MSDFLYLVPIALSLGGAALLAFIWSLRNRQYDDLERAAVRVLSDHEAQSRPMGSAEERSR
jgi:cbb3-type cytochrome oxidase maturation protein